MAVKASVWSTTIEPPEGRRIWRSYAFSICDSIWKRLNSGMSSEYILSLRRFCGITDWMKSRACWYIRSVSTSISPTSARR